MGCPSGAETSGSMMLKSKFRNFCRGFAKFGTNGLDTTKVVNVGGFTSGQKQFPEFHRNAVLLQSVSRVKLSLTGQAPRPAALRPS